MGCSASMTQPMTIQSVKKVDVSTNTGNDECSPSSIPPVNAIKHLIEVYTQTDDYQVNLETNQTTFSEKNDNKDSNLKSNDADRISVNGDEVVGWKDNRINPRFDQNCDDREEFEWILNDMDATQFSLNIQSMLMSIGQITPAMVIDAIEKTGDLKDLPKAVWNLLDMARKTGDATYLIRAYTAESDFYKVLNKKLARQNLGNSTDQTLEDQLQTTMTSAFTQLGHAMSAIQAYQAGQQMQNQNNNETDWTKLFLKLMYQLIMIPNSILRY
jgi:hypothetical protein